MFHIGVVELGLTCGLLLLVLIVPVMVGRFYARLDQRLKKIEKDINNRK
jgi:hypothetical protein